MKEVHTINYYPINEGAARRAKEMNSFSDYKEGSATAEYRAMVDKAAAIAEKQKSRVDPMYHEKIDHLLDTYARKLAENMNQGFAIDARVPSVMIAGPANFPVGKKEKQNRARDSNMEEWRYIQGLLDKIRSTGMGEISADDPAAIEKLQKKLDGLERSQLIMKEVNAYYRKDHSETIMGNMDSIVFLGGREASTLKDISENWLGKATISMQTEGRSRGQSESYSQNMQRLGRELMTTSEITTMPGDKCILQLRGLPPFLSPKYDLKKHPNYKYTAEFDKKKNAFRLESLFRHRPLRLKPEDEYTVYETSLLLPPNGIAFSQAICSCSCA